MKIIIALFMVLMLTSLLLISNHNLYLSNDNDAREFGKLWLGWFDETFMHAKALTGYIAQIDWLP